MNSWLLNKYHKIHIIGIGGIGMSAIARVLLTQGFTVTGSDLRSSEITKGLEDLGAVIFKGHSAKNITDQDLVIYSSAVKGDNPELAECKRRSITAIKRPVALRELMRGFYGIGIAGSHGKTTTTAMVSKILIDAGLDPTVIVGGIVQELNNTNARVGEGDYFVIEADEYDRTFLSLNPVLEIITNVEAEHMDTYKRYENVINAFVKFGNKVPFYGNVFVCIDDVGVESILPFFTVPTVTYGLGKEAQIKAENIKQEKAALHFDVSYFGENIGEFVISLPGLHNVRNALAAIGLGMEIGIDVESIKTSLKEFKGVARRFQTLITEPMMVIDDYAHHPSEVKASLDAAKSFGAKRVVAVFQPHLYSRTLDFRKNFALALSEADEIFVLDVYPAREKPIEGVTGHLIVDELKKLGKENVFYLPKKEDLTTTLLEHTKEKDLVLAMGAGDITNLIKEFAEAVKHNA